MPLGRVMKTQRPTSTLSRRGAPLGLVVLAIASLSASRAEAKGTYFLIELGSGLSESAYSAGAAGLTYGLSAGTTFKPKALPIRFALLANVAGRNASAGGFHEGVPFSAARTDLDLYVSERTIIPVWRFVRFYVEAGLGQRWQSQTIDRGGDLGRLSSRSSDLLLVLAAGLEARLNSLFSVGLRGELNPLSPDPDLATLAADLAPTSNRSALTLQLGLHF